MVLALPVEAQLEIEKTDEMGGQMLMKVWQKLVPEFDIDPKVDGFVYSRSLNAFTCSDVADIVNELLSETPA